METAMATRRAPFSRVCAFRGAFRSGWRHVEGACPRKEASCARTGTLRAGWRRQASSIGGSYEESPDAPSVFPRIKERNPYRLLGVSRDASFDEIRDAKDFLVAQHRGHERSVEAIEVAYDKIIEQKLKIRNKFGMKSTKKEKKDGQFEAKNLVEKIKMSLEVVVAKEVIVKRVAIFLALAAWSVVQQGVNGPAFQVAVGFIGAAYLINDKRQKRLGGEEAKSTNTALGSAGMALIGLVVGWLLGSIIQSRVPLFAETLLPQTVAAIFGYIGLFVVTTFFK